MSEGVPLLDPRRGLTALAKPLTEAFRRVLHSGQYINGPEVEAFESALAARLGVAHAVGVSSGTDALLVALMALDIGPGDEVIVPTYTFFATAGAVARLGATPVFVDVDEASFNVRPSEVEAAITDRTRAIVPVHLFGRCVDVPALARLGLPIVEDAAQALGATHEGAEAGSMGGLGCFSFFPTKNLGGFGDGGLVSAQDAALAARVRKLARHGAAPKYFHEEVGGNFRLDPLQAALLRVKLAGLDRALERRRAHAAAYREGLEGVDGLILPADAPGHTYNQFVVRIPGRRDAVRAALTEAGVGTALYYPLPLHRQACFSSLGYAEGSLPRSERLAGETLAIPVFPELRHDERDRVIEALRRALC